MRNVYSFDIYPSGRTDGVNHDTLREAVRASRGAYMAPGETIRFFRDTVGGRLGEITRGATQIARNGRVLRTFEEFD